MSKFKMLFEGISAENIIRQIAANGRTWGLLFLASLFMAEACAWIYVHSPRTEKQIFLATPQGVDIDLVWEKFSPHLSGSFSKDLPRLDYHYVHRNGADTQRLLILSAKSFFGNADKMSSELEKFWEKDLSDRYLKSLGLTLLENQLSLRPIQDPTILKEKIALIQEQLPYYQRLIQEKPPLAPLVPFPSMETNEKQNYFIPIEYHLNALRMEMADLQKELDFFNEHQAKNAHIQEAIKEIKSTPSYSGLISQKASENQGRANDLWNDLCRYASTYQSFLIDSRTPAGPTPRKDVRFVYIQVFVITLLIAMIALFLISWKRKDQALSGK